MGRFALATKGKGASYNVPDLNLSLILDFLYKFFSDKEMCI